MRDTVPVLVSRLRSRRLGGGRAAGGAGAEDDVAVVFAPETAEEFEGADEQDYTDAAAGEHAFGGYVPGGGDEA